MNAKERYSGVRERRKRRREITLSDDKPPIVVLDLHDGEPLHGDEFENWLCDTSSKVTTRYD